MYCYHWRVIGVRILSRSLASDFVTKLIFHVGVGAVCAQDIILLLLYTVSRVKGWISMMVVFVAA